MTPAVQLLAAAVCGWVLGKALVAIADETVAAIRERRNGAA